MIAEYFAFLPYGKYAFYIWFSYLMAFLVVAVLFIRTRSIHHKIWLQLQLKYNREKHKKTDDKTTK